MLIYTFTHANAQTCFNCAFHASIYMAYISQNDKFLYFNAIQKLQILLEVISDNF